MTGILTMLYSVNIRVLGNKANISLLKESHLINRLLNATDGVLSAGAAQLILIEAVVTLIIVLLNLFFHSDLGLALGALGGNERMVVAQGANPKVLKIIGVGLSNSLVALSGAFVAQYQGFADANPLLMIDRGEIVFEARDSEKGNLTVDSLVKKNHDIRGESLTNDETLLS